MLVWEGCTGNIQISTGPTLLLYHVTYCSINQFNPAWHLALNDTSNHEFDVHHCIIKLLNVITPTSLSTGFCLHPVEKSTGSFGFFDKGDPMQLENIINNNYVYAIIIQLLFVCTHVLKTGSWYNGIPGI